MDSIPRLSLDRSSATPLTEQLAAQLREAVLSGELRPGNRLPATRRLAETLGVSRSVVVGAYEQLSGEAFVDSAQGSGTRISSALPGWVLGPAAQHVQPAAQQGPPSRPIPPADAPIDLRTGRPFAAPKPPRDWVRALSSAARESWRSDSVDPLGDEALRRELAAHVRVSRGVNCSEDDVIVTSGTSEALLLIGVALRRLHAPRIPTVAVEDPGYGEGIDALRCGGVEPHPVAVGEHGIDAGALERLGVAGPVDAVMLTPSHQFPTGGRLPAHERLAILDWAHRTGAIVIEDDYDSEFRHTGAVLPAVASLDGRGVALYVASLNKVLSPSLRCGLLVLPSGRPELCEALVHARRTAGSSVSAHTQRALSRFIAGGGMRRVIARNRREYGHRRGAVLELLSRRGIRVSGADGGLHVVIEVARNRDSGAIADALEDRGVLVETLAQFSAGADRGDGLVLGYGAESLPRLTRGVELVAAALSMR